MKIRTVTLALLTMLPALAHEAGAREQTAQTEGRRTPTADARTATATRMTTATRAALDARRQHIITASDLLADEQGMMSTVHLRAALDSAYFMAHVPPLMRHQLSSIAARAGDAIPFSTFEPFLEVVAMAKAPLWNVLHGEYTRVRVAITLTVVEAPTEVAVALVEDWVCTGERMCAAAQIFGRSTLIREALQAVGSDLATFIADAEDPLLEIYKTAWTAVAEAKFLEALGIPLNSALTPEQIADLIDEATGSGSMPHGMSGVADQLRADLLRSPASCHGDTMGLANGPFGMCGLPEMPTGGPGGGDPSPIDGAAMGGGGPGPSLGMTPMNGGWGIPGGCQGLNPSEIFNGNAGAGQEIQGQPNPVRTLDAVVNRVFEATLKSLVGLNIGAGIGLLTGFAKAIDSVPAVAFPDPVPPGATPEPDTSTSDEAAETHDEGPCPEEGCGGGDEGSSSPSTGTGGGGYVDPLGDGAPSLADACGNAVGSALVGCMFPSQPQATHGGNTALLCNAQMPADCGFEACDFACACQNTDTGDVCSPAPGDAGPAACAEDTGDEVDACPESCEVLVVASMVSPGLMPPDQLPDECQGCGVVSAESEDHPCFGDEPMPPAALVPLCGAMDPVWDETQAMGRADPWAGEAHMTRAAEPMPRRR
ncbi:MAG: hypothetical protein ACE366_21050 [Bradymonadia bacterium]